MPSVTLCEYNMPEKLYLKLSLDADTDDALYSFSMISLSVIESMESSTSITNVKFVDATGQLFSQYPFVPDKKFYVTFGTTSENAIVTEYKFSTLNYDVTNSRDVSNIIVSMDLISANWELMFKKKHNRSWTNVTYSDVVYELAEEMGFEYDGIDIEDTQGTHTVIQPNWTNAQLLKWLAMNSVNDNGVGGFVYGVRNDNQFFFKTFHTLYGEGASDNTVGEYSYDTMGTNEKGFNDVSVKNSYMPTMVNTGFGTGYTYFDYATKTFVDNTKTITDIDENQLSDWYYIAENHVEDSGYLYGGRDTNIDALVQNKIQSSTNSIHKMEITIRGTNEIHIGNLIQLLFPSSTRIIEDDNVIINEIYSGYWLIWKAVNMFDVSSQRYFTRLFLSRSGVNGLELQGFASTPVGKALV